ncbi:DUF982 domain-containing protein [Rhizobium sp. JAB6]|nr:DUF982 domain-containing protein [Rhizobium sp. JAB6]
MQARRQDVRSAGTFRFPPCSVRRRIRGMTQIWWNKSVTVEARKTGLRVNIPSVERASEYMLHEWPTLEEGPAFHVAKEALLKASDGRLDPEAARKAFLEAVKEGNIFIFDA